jgi:hypothetical protein
MEKTYFSFLSRLVPFLAFVGSKVFFESRKAEPFLDVADVNPFRHIAIIGIQKILSLGRTIDRS